MGEACSYCSLSRISNRAFFVRGLPSVSNTFTFFAGNTVSPEMISSAWAADVPISKTLFLFSGITTVHEYFGLRLRMRITSGRSQAAPNGR